MGEGRLTSDEMQQREKSRFALPKKKKKKRQRVKTVSVMIPTKLHNQLKKKAKSIGVTMAALVKTYIDNGLNGRVYRETAEVIRSGRTDYKFKAKKGKQPATYQQPGYFAELKEALERRKKKTKK